MNQELLERTLKNRRIELTNQEKKDYYPKENLFILLFASAIVLLMPLMAKAQGGDYRNGVFMVFRIVSCRLCCGHLHHLLE